MGISGLLPLLKDVSEDIHVSKYSGKVLGVDAYVWLHRGAYGCAEALALGKPTTRYVDYAMAQINMLRHHGVKPYIVFDGDRLPAKAKTEADREKRRSDSLELARGLMAGGKRREAQEQYARCVDVTPAMAFQLIKRLRALKIDYIVAPYEADAQLAFLERCGVLQGIVTEDSDLLVFGCKTVLYKMDKEGNCVELLRHRIAKCKALPMHAFDVSMFRKMAILSGCDYLPSIPKMGIKKAHTLLRQCGTVPRVLAAAATQNMQVPTGYRDAFQRAERTFVYQRVFHRTPTGEVKMCKLTHFEGGDDDEDEDDECIGPLMTSAEAHAIANGDVDPISRRPIEDLSRDKDTDTAKASASEPRKSFYAQTPFMRSQNRKNGNTNKPLIPGQGKLDSFFSKSTTASTSSSSAGPVQSFKEDQLSSSAMPPSTKTSGQINRMGNVPADAQRAKHAAALESRSPVLSKSKYFGQLSPRSSPVRLYDCDADLAKFSTPSKRATRMREASNPLSDGGMISSPGSAEKTLAQKGTGLHTSPLDVLSLDDGMIGGAPPSSPCTSPTLGFSARAGGQSSKLPLAQIINKVESNNLFARFAFECDGEQNGSIGKPKRSTSGEATFQTPLAAFSGSVSTAQGKAKAFMTTVQVDSCSKGTLDLDRFALRHTDGSDRSVCSTSSNKRSLSIANMDEDSEHDQENALRTPCYRPAAVRARSDTPSTKSGGRWKPQSPIDALSTPHASVATVKRTNSNRKLTLF